MKLKLKGPLERAEAAAKRWRGDASSTCKRHTCIECDMRQEAYKAGYLAATRRTGEKKAKGKR